MQRSDIETKQLILDNALFLPRLVDLINEGHSVTLNLKGISMRPFLEDGRDKALLTKPNGIKKGDVVLAEISQGVFVLHRIWAIDGNHVTLLGDGNLVPEHCTRSDVKAIATGFWRKGRTQICTTQSKKWKVYSWIWVHLYPIRRWILAIHRRLIRWFGAENVA